MGWTIENVAAHWRARSVRGGGAVCPECDHPRVALHVDENGAYQWCCVACGRHSPRFFIERGLLGLDGRRGTFVIGDLPSPNAAPTLREGERRWDSEKRDPNER